MIIVVIVEIIPKPEHNFVLRRMSDAPRESRLLSHVSSQGRELRFRV